MILAPIGGPGDSLTLPTLKVRLEATAAVARYQVVRITPSTLTGTTPTAAPTAVTDHDRTDQRSIFAVATEAADASGDAFVAIVYGEATVTGDTADIEAGDAIALSDATGGEGLVEEAAANEWCIGIALEAIAAGATGRVFFNGFATGGLGSAV